MLFVRYSALFLVVVGANLVLSKKESKRNTDRLWNLNKEEWNSWITDYLNLYQSVANKMDKTTQGRMSIVQNLIIQTWIRTLHPDLTQVKQFVPKDPSTTVEDLSENLLKSLKETGQAGVEDAVFEQENHLIIKIKEKIEKEAPKYGVNEKNKSRLSTFNSAFSYKMCLQSFVYNFLQKPYPKNYDIKRGDAQVSFHPKYYTGTDWTKFYGTN